MGDLAALGTARLIGLAAELLAALAANRDDVPCFAHHAFLDVRLEGRTVAAVLDFHPEECPGISSRCAALLENQHDVSPAMFAGKKEPKALLAMLMALSADLRVSYSLGSTEEAVISNRSLVFPAQPAARQGAWIAAHFQFVEQIDSSGLTQDYLEGFLQGAAIMPGLLVRDITVISSF
ncbi:hypothetical protein N6L27_12095 [Leisingera sp. SS27]|uniref:hypothetical protein n=1 Tax=Leisingera sp. SS27 TaxID=2979462 RepID=UPI00232E0402|nr:hypothetical protein [Leisingera sp. SS27]MDC0658743.1 hypothetical protein [Leisingera sp. SS27]